LTDTAVDVIRKRERNASPDGRASWEREIHLGHEYGAVGNPGSLAGQEGTSCRGPLQPVATQPLGAAASSSLISDAREVEIFSTCLPSRNENSRTYLERVTQVAQWSDEAGYRGMLVYTDNGLVDPWLVAQVVLQQTEQLCPLVAVQPVYMHPYSVAKMVASLAFLHGRRIYLNVVAGGFRNDLLALGDDTPHDERYERAVEYTLIMKGLLSGDAVTVAGRYYRVENLRLTPSLPPELAPGILISGSSEAGARAAEAISATRVKYPQPPGDEALQAVNGSGPAGIRVGIITRPEADEAWDVAHRRFPEDRKGKITHKLAMQVSDSKWHKQLSRLGRHPGSEANHYWLVPFENYKTFCPYLVGSYDRVGSELAHYMSLGFSTFILDVPVSPDDLEHTAAAFEHASRQLKS
jgi:alkanesulfonate monooxygenase